MDKYKSLRAVEDDNTLTVIFGKNAKKMSNDAINVLSRCELSDKEVIFSEIITRNVYEEIKQALTNIGGVWKGKGTASNGMPKGSFVFERFNPKIIVKYIVDNGLMPIKNPTAFFPTPRKVVEEMLDFVGYNEDSDNPILEPSAGTGGILDIIREINPNAVIDAVEYLSVNVAILEDKGYNVTQSDFLKLDTNKRYRYVIMNPPFDNTAYIDHVYKAFSLLETVGDLVAIVPNTLHRTDNKTVDFWSFVYANFGSVEELEENSFAESGTKVHTLIIRVEKNHYPSKDTNEYAGHKNFQCWRFLVEQENDQRYAKELDYIFLRNRAKIDKGNFSSFEEDILAYIKTTRQDRQIEFIFYDIDDGDREYLVSEYLERFFEMAHEEIRKGYEWNMPKLSGLLDDGLSLEEAQKALQKGKTTTITNILKISLSKVLEIAKSNNKTAIKTLMDKINQKKGLGNIRKQREYETINNNVYWTGILKHSLNKVLHIAKTSNKTKIQQLINKL